MPFKNFGFTLLLEGPKNSPFEGTRIFLRFQYPKDYPCKAPKVKFTTKIYRPNIADSGILETQRLHHAWDPPTTLINIIDEICEILVNPDLNSPMRPEVAEEFKNDRAEYERKAKKSVEDDG
jgi:ubiquitin-conjugating enzyme E2 D/E